MLVRPATVRVHLPAMRAATAACMQRGRDPASAASDLRGTLPSSAQAQYGLPSPPGAASSRGSGRPGPSAAAVSAPTRLAAPGTVWRGRGAGEELTLRSAGPPPATGLRQARLLLAWLMALRAAAGARRHGWGEARRCSGAAADSASRRRAALGRHQGARLLRRRLVLRCCLSSFGLLKQLDGVLEQLGGAARLLRCHRLLRRLLDVAAAAASSSRRPATLQLMLPTSAACFCCAPLQATSSPGLPALARLCAHARPVPQRRAAVPRLGRAARAARAGLPGRVDVAAWPACAGPGADGGAARRRGGGGAVRLLDCVRRESAAAVAEAGRHCAAERGRLGDCGPQPAAPAGSRASKPCMHLLNLDCTCLPPPPSRCTGAGWRPGNPPALR